MLRRTLLAAALPCAAGALAGKAATKTKLRVSVGPYVAMCPFFVGYEAGYFAEAGFDIEVQREPGSVQVIPLIAGGRIDVCFLGDHPSLLNAIARGARIRIVAGRELASATCHPVGAVYVSRKSFPNGIRNLRPLKGARVAVVGSLGAIAHYALDALLAHDGMRPDDVQAERMGAAESVAALRAGGVAALVSRGSDLDALPDSLQLSRGPVFANVQPGFQFSWIVFGRGLLDGDAQTGARFLRAYLRGASDFLKGRTPAFMDELARSQGLDPKVVRAGCRDTFVHDGAIRVPDLQRFVRWAVAKGYCPGTLDAAALIDTRFLAAMNGVPLNG
jgi:NitT/TauT family transport system substrate-binding protein